MERAHAPFDFIGINNYTRRLITTAEPAMPGGLPGCGNPLEPIGGQRLGC
jgi:hypothetical protein